MSNVRPEGFTTIELLTVIAIVGIMAVIVSLPLSSMQNSSAVRDAAVSVGDALRRAQIQAASGYLGDSWGVHFSEGAGCSLPAAKYWIFRGQTFDPAAADSESFDLPGTARLTDVSLGGGCDVRFFRSSGSASAAGSVTVTSDSNETRTIQINRYGRIGQ